MIRSLVVSILAGAGLFAVGCAQHVAGIVASAPSPQLTGRVPSTGHYILYRVNRFDPNHGAPADVTEVAAYDLQEGERIGFEWNVNHDSLNRPSSELNLIAFAGNNRQNLGPLTSQQQKYYWATSAGWHEHWPAENINGFARRMTLQD